MRNPLAFYYAARWFYKHRIPFLPSILQGFLFLIFNAVVPYRTDIGSNCRLGHGGVGVVIHPDAKIGNNVLIGNCVTVGGRKTGESVPVIGDNVYIGTGAKVLGAVIVGNNSVIGANSVVIKCVPPYSVVAGVPARILRNDVDSRDVTSWQKGSEKRVVISSLGTLGRGKFRTGFKSISHVIRIAWLDIMEIQS